MTIKSLSLTLRQLHSASHANVCARCALHIFRRLVLELDSAESLGVEILKRSALLVYPVPFWTGRNSPCSSCNLVPRHRPCCFQLLPGKRVLTSTNRVNKLEGRVSTTQSQKSLLLVLSHSILPRHSDISRSGRFSAGACMKSMPKQSGMPRMWSG
jgi:hypothetical protein